MIVKFLLCHLKFGGLQFVTLRQLLHMSFLPFTSVDGKQFAFGGGCIGAHR